MEERVHQRSVSVDDTDSMIPEPGSTKASLVEDISFNGEVVNGDLQRAGEVLTKVELDLACSSEKLVNLNILMMQVATRESDFESFSSEKKPQMDELAGKALEFDLLSGILDSEVDELNRFISTLHTDVDSAHEVISSLQYMGESFSEMEEKLHDCENSLKQSQEQLSDMRTQSANFQRILSAVDGVATWLTNQGVEISLESHIPGTNTRIKMQTAEQQRHFLRMLEKSLAREMELEKKLTEMRQVEEELRMKLQSSEQKAFYLEEDVEDAYRRRFEAENSAEVLKGVSKDLLGKHQLLHFNLNGLIQRENKLTSELLASKEQLEAKESALQKLGSSSARLNDFLLAQTETLKASLKEAEENLIISNSENFTLKEKVSSLEEQLKDYESQQLDGKSIINNIEDLKEKVFESEARAEAAESKCKLLSETNMELNDELGLLKRSGFTLERMESLQKQLKESDMQLQHAVASIEASKEKQNMLYSTIADMQNLIDDLKLKVSKAESRADNAEEKLIIVSESNAGLNEEVSFLRGRLDCVQASLHQAEEIKLQTVRDIGVRTKMMMNLVMQLAAERERLHKQISTLSMENSMLVVKLKLTEPFQSGNDGVKDGKCTLSPKYNLSSNSDTDGNMQGTTESSPASPELEKRPSKSVLEAEAEGEDSISKLEDVRRLDAGVLSLKHISMALLFVLISLSVYYFQHQNCPF